MPRPVESRIAVVGAGVAGTLVVDALARRGIADVAWLDHADPRRGSDSPVALVQPFAGRSFAGDDALVDTWREAVARLEAAVAAGTVHRAPLRRRIADDEGGARLWRSRDRGAELADAAGLRFVESRDDDGCPVLEYGPVYGVALPRWLAAVRGGLADHGIVVRSARVVEVAAAGGWSLVLADGTEVRARHVVLAAGPGARALLRAHVDVDDLEHVEGVTAFARGGPLPAFVVDRGHLVSTPDTVGWGATFRALDGPDDREHDLQLAAIEARLRPWRPAGLGATGTWTGLRVVDRRWRRPWAREVADGLWVLGALGSQGLFRGPRAASRLVAELAGR